MPSGSVDGVRPSGAQPGALHSQLIATTQMDEADYSLAQPATHPERQWQGANDAADRRALGRLTGQMPSVQLAVGKGDEQRPIRIRHIMSPGADVIANALADRSVGRRHRITIHPFQSI